MHENPNQWYLDALERKRKSELRWILFWFIFPKLMIVSVVITLIVIAFKL